MGSNLHVKFIPIFFCDLVYSITPQYLILDKKKLPLYDDGEFVSCNTAQTIRINVDEPDQEVFIGNDPNIPDGIYLIKSNQLTVPYHYYDRNSRIDPCTELRTHPNDKRNPPNRSHPGKDNYCTPTGRFKK